MKTKKILSLGKRLGEKDIHSLYDPTDHSQTAKGKMWLHGLVMTDTASPW